MLPRRRSSRRHLRHPIPGNLALGTPTEGRELPEQEELIAHRMSVEEIRVYLGADSLGYLPVESLWEAEGEGRSTFCEACFTGEYPVQPQGREGDSQVPLFGEHTGS